MKIAVLSPVAWRTPPLHYGPWEQMASNLTEGLAAKGIDVTLFATADSQTAGKLSAIVPQAYEEDKNTDAKVSECMHISYLMEQAGKFDIIHNHFDFLPLTYARLIKTPIVTTIHGFSSPQILPVYQRYNDIVRYVSISNADRHPTLKYTATVYNGIRSGDFRYTQGAESYLLYYGRIHADKGTHEAIQIALQSNRQLYIAGIIQDEAYYNEKVRPYIDNDQIRYLGAVGGEERNSLLGRAHALLHPIHFKEPFGLSVAEAMYCGTPVIAFNKGSMPELIKDGKTGFLTNNVHEAAEAIADLRQIDRYHCHLHAKEHFSAEKMVEGYLDVYKNL
ncbi:glycosyltransferase family 4 protein [Chitinophaga silvatica]|uniref:Glycosyltransferase family 4 protein n=1 Tax=Chitinophaga silvatica TaxID=2282649 RepID=A0A3E1Y9G9_9BACT|nr:glycosyltransferase family 4 protein [Chitinophaga silvatica]RFS22043.1 glycosyltransferase family 4 protein [Chitinophaga silvatica]